jgi:hypothetical protein
MLFVGFTVQGVYLIAAMPIPSDRILVEVQQGHEILKSLADTSAKLDVQMDRIEGRLEQTLPPDLADAVFQKLSQKR